MKTRALAVLFLAAGLLLLVNRFRQPPPAPTGASATVSGVARESSPVERSAASPPPSGGASGPLEAGVPAAPSRLEPLASGVLAGMPQTRTEAGAPSGSAPPAVAAAPAALVIPEAQGLAELENVRIMLRDYRTRMGDNPVGSNAEIMQAVMGRNPAAARLGPPPGQSLNAAGELLDPWGTPWFFHQLSAQQMEVRSAGPDKILWSADDLAGK